MDNQIIYTYDGVPIPFGGKLYTRDLKTQNFWFNHNGKKKRVPWNSPLYDDLNKIWNQHGEKWESNRCYPSDYDIPDADVPVLICLLCMDIRMDWSNVAQVRRRYCMLLELAVRLGNKEIIDHILDYHVESRDEGRWMRCIYDPEVNDNKKYLDAGDNENYLLSNDSVELIIDYGSKALEWRKSLKDNRISFK